MSTRPGFICWNCRTRLSNVYRRSLLRSYQSTSSKAAEASRPSIAPKTTIDIKHIRQHPELYKQNCIDRNYKTQSAYPSRIIALFEEWQDQQKQGRGLRERNNLLRRRLSKSASAGEDGDGTIPVGGQMTKEEIIAESKKLNDQLAAIEEKERQLMAEVDVLARSIPNLTSDQTPRGNDFKVIGHINSHPDQVSHAKSRVWRSHVDIGNDLSILDFTASATSTGWGWYYLLGQAALLEQALIQYSLSVAMSYGWQIVSPPSIVYSHIASACGFQPRDQNDEQQIYSLSQPEADKARGKPELSLAATAEIPLAAMKANSTIDSAELPLKRIAVSRCYRAEAGARGVDTKGLYRVHEFTKVEMFGWTLPSYEAATEVFDEMVAIQTKILKSLGLHCQILEMPTTDLGASATRKIDIEAFFPSRKAKNDGYGEVTSASICTDYQTRRLATRMKSIGSGGKLEFPWTVNGTALAVPRVLAAILENGWNEDDKSVLIPECLRPYMAGKSKIETERKLN